MLKRKFIGDKKFYLMLLSVVVPIVLQQFITQFVSLIDNLMIGRIGNSEMTGVSLANQLLFVFNLAIFGSLSGASIFASQYYGAGNKEGYQQTFKFKWFMGVIIVVISSLLFVTFSEELLSFFINSKDGDFSDPTVVLASGKKYLMVMLVGNIPFLIKEIYATSLREMKETFFPMLSGVIAIGVNLILNAILIFGLIGFPKLGVIGAAIATVVSRFVEMILVIIYSHLKTNKHPLFKNIYKGEILHKESIKKFIPKTLMLLANETFWSLGLTLMLSCYSFRGVDIVSAFSINNTVYNVFITVGTSLGNATAIVLGAMLGAKKVEEAKNASFKIMAFSFLVTLLFMSLQIACSFFVPSIYDTSGGIREMATKLIIISALFLPFNAINTVCYFTLRAGGMMLITILFDSVFVMCVRLPIAYVLCHFTPMSIYGIFAIVTGVDLIKIFIGYYLINKGVWIKSII